MYRLVVTVEADYWLSEEDAAQWKSMTRDEHIARLNEIEDGARSVVASNMDDGATVVASARMAVYPE